VPEEANGRAGGISSRFAIKYINEFLIAKNIARDICRIDGRPWEAQEETTQEMQIRQMETINMLHACAICIDIPS
jgi:hypothetical protein